MFTLSTSLTAKIAKQLVQTGFSLFHLLCKIPNVFKISLSEISCHSLVHVMLLLRLALAAVVKDVLYLVEGLAASFRQQEERVEHHQEAEEREHPEADVLAKGGADVHEELGHEEANEPAEGGSDGRTNGFDVRREHLRHDSPWQRPEPCTMQQRLVTALLSRFW